MSRKKNPLGKSLSSIIDDLNNINETTLEKLEKQTEKKKTTEDVQTTAHVKSIRGGVIQKTLPIISENVSKKYFDLDKVGQILRQKREEKAFSVADISEALCYRKTIIKAIESGDWDNLPHIVYVKGYVRSYSELLGVNEDVDPYLKEDLQKGMENLTENVVKTIKEPKKTRELNISSWSAFKIPKTVLFYASVMIVVVGFFVFDYIYKDRKITSKFENAVHVANSVTIKEENKIISQIADTKKLMITCHERTWVSVIIDGTEKKELMLKPEEVVILNAKEKFDLLVGNAGGIKIFLNGKDSQFTGEKGQVKRVTLS